MYSLFSGEKPCFLGSNGVVIIILVDEWMPVQSLECCCRPLFVLLCERWMVSCCACVVYSRLLHKWFLGRNSPLPSAWERHLKPARVSNWGKVKNCGTRVLCVVIVDKRFSGTVQGLKRLMAESKYDGLMGVASPSLFHVNVCTIIEMSNSVWGQKAESILTWNKRKDCFLYWQIPFSTWKEFSWMTP